jgi:hypothetical protein
MGSVDAFTSGFGETGGSAISFWKRGSDGNDDKRGNENNRGCYDPAALDEASIP